MPKNEKQPTGVNFFPEFEKQLSGAPLYLSPTPELSGILSSLTKQDFSQGLITLAWFAGRGAFHTGKILSEEIERKIVKGPKSTKELTQLVWNVLTVGMPGVNGDTTVDELKNPIPFLADPAKRKYLVDGLNVFFGASIKSHMQNFSPLNWNADTILPGIEAIRNDYRVVEDTLPFHFYGPSNDLLKIGSSGLIIPSLDYYFSRAANQGPVLAEKLALSDEQKQEFAQTFAEAIRMLKLDREAYTESLRRQTRVKNIHPTIRELCDEINYQSQNL